jgi:hypothetical protein
MSAIPVAGIGGLGMLALVVIMAIAFPAARWLRFGGLAGGLLVALALVLGRRKHRLGAPRGDLPTSLFSSLTVDETSSAGDEGRSVASDQHRLATC